MYVLILYLSKQPRSDSILIFLFILGAFLIPYVISLVCMGLPVFLFEMGSGQFSSEGPVGLWKICPLFQGKVP